MAGIIVLDESTAIRIAAGEVVERPASVVKELVENALDAGADRITVETAGGGRQRIVVVDNGCGMGRDDVALCLERHATSKVRTVGDLDAITTLGFRGEALPSIAAVSRFGLRTRAGGGGEGTVVRAEGGRVLSAEAAGCPVGTMVTVEDLFYNTPARQKFLKSPAAEAAAITDLMGRLALSRPGVRFRLVQNGRAVFETTGSGRLDEAFAAVFGFDQAREMVPVDYRHGGLAVSGLVGKPGLTRANRRGQICFVNGRYVRSYLLSRGLENACAGVIPGGRFPVAALYLELDPALVDVNVHPAKTEVRFEKGREIVSHVVGAVRRALAVGPVPGEDYDAPISGADRKGAPVPLPAGRTRDRRPMFFPSMGGSGRPVVGEDGAAYEAPPALRALAQLPPVYILAGGPDGLYIVDQHAAHERILYERLLTASAESPAAGQMLVGPQVIRLDARSVELLKRYGDYLSTAGFVLEEFGFDGFLLRGAPAVLRRGTEREALQDIIDRLGDARPTGREAFVRTVAASLACRRAVRGGDRLTLTEMQELLDQLLAAGTPLSCPHGRPTAIRITNGELARRFLRE